MFSRPRRRTQLISGAAMVVLLGLAVGSGAVAVNAFGVGDRFDHLLARVDRYLAGPPPDRPAPSTVLVTDPEDEEEESEAPEPTATPIPQATPSGPTDPAASPAATPEPTPTPTPAPQRKRVDVDIVSKPKTVFASELRDTWCSPAGVQMTLAVLGHGGHVGRVPEGAPAQRSQVGELRRQPQRRLGTGRHGPRPRRLRRPRLRGPRLQDPERRAARRGEGDPQDELAGLLLAWRGAHTWVMTGFRADADPLVFKDAKVSGAYILDPWYPRSRASGARPTRPARSRTPPRWSVTTSVAAGPRATTRTATTCTSRSSRPCSAP